MRSPLTLAALATVAVPGLDAYDARRPRGGGSEFDVAVVTDAARRRWVVRAPQHTRAGATLEAEVALLEGLAPFAASGQLPFAVPQIAGSAHLPEGGRAVVYPELPGRPIALDGLTGGPGLAAELGRAIAALHELPTHVVEPAGLASYDAAAYRARRLAEVDEAAKTGLVPSALLRRWEGRLEDVSVWRFQPTVVHGDLTATHVLTDGATVTGIVDWGETKVADPADDLAWLVVAAPSDALDAITEAYQLRRTELTDPYLTDRALLAGELALARWLLYGVRTDQQDVVDDAVQMLEDLEAHCAEAAVQQADDHLLDVQGEASGPPEVARAG